MERPKLQILNTFICLSKCLLYVGISLHILSLIFCRPNRFRTGVDVTKTKITEQVLCMEQFIYVIFDWILLRTKFPENLSQFILNTKCSSFSRKAKSKHGLYFGFNTFSFTDKMLKTGISKVRTEIKDTRLFLGNKQSILYERAVL